jgi:hypothetical protein
MRERDRGERERNRNKRTRERRERESERESPQYTQAVHRHNIGSAQAVNRQRIGRQ